MKKKRPHLLTPPHPQPSLGIKHSNARDLWGTSHSNHHTHIRIMQPIYNQINKRVFEAADMVMKSVFLALGKQAGGSCV